MFTIMSIHTASVKLRGERDGENVRLIYRAPLWLPSESLHWRTEKPLLILLRKSDQGKKQMKTVWNTFVFPPHNLMILEVVRKEMLIMI